MSIMPQDPNGKTYHPSAPAEAWQDDGCSCGSLSLLTYEHDNNCTLVRCRRCGMDLPDHLPGDEHCRPCTRPHLDASQPSADTEKLRRVLLDHHPIAHSMTGPLKGCRCGQVMLGQDVIGHVIEQISAALDAR